MPAKWREREIFEFNRENLLARYWHPLGRMMGMLRETLGMPIGARRNTVPAAPPRAW